MRNFVNIVPSCFNETIFSAFYVTTYFPSLCSILDLDSFSISALNLIVLTLHWARAILKREGARGVSVHPNFQEWIGSLKFWSLWRYNYENFALKMF